MAVRVDGVSGRSLRIPFGLGQDVLGSEGNLLGLDDTEEVPIDDESVIRRTIRGSVFRHGVAGIATRRLHSIKWDDLPAGRPQERVDSFRTRGALGFGEAWVQTAKGYRHLQGRISASGDDPCRPGGRTRGSAVRPSSSPGT